MVLQHGPSVDPRALGGGEQHAAEDENTLQMQRDLVEQMKRKQRDVSIAEQVLRDFRAFAGNARR